MPPTQQPNFKVDVNRAKTQKWAAAKQASYGGDDWGGYDEYDEYDDYEEPPPPPKQTGLRQRGQASSSSIDYPSSAGPIPPASQAPRLQKMQSFEAGDDRRTVSPGIDQPLGAQGTYAQSRGSPVSAEAQSRAPMYDQRTSSSTTPYSGTGPQHTRPPPQQDSYGAGEMRSPLGIPPVQTSNLPPGTRPVEGQSPGQGRHYSRTTSAASTTPSSAGDIYHRRDFSPSAVPQPLTTRASPSQEFRPPARKDSLDSSYRPSLPPSRQQSYQMNKQPLPSIAPPQDMTPRPQRTPSPEMQASPPMFVRPADIYKRMGEEKERERQSIESGRPSMDTIDRAAGSTNRGVQPPRTSQESARDQENRTGLKPVLDPVTERKSEYGMDGFAVNDPALARAKGANVQANDSNMLSEPPSLPQLGRFSGFGMDLGFGDNGSALSHDRSDQTWGAGTIAPANVISNDGSQSLSEPDTSDLQHQPSLGFRTAVNQAFDGHDERAAVPPSSNPGSQRSKNGSEVSRSNTDSTGNISPIMSRVPSGKTAAARLQAQERLATTPSITEEEQGPGTPNSRPNSTGTLKGLMQPANALGETLHSRNTSGESSLTPATSHYSREYSAPNAVNVPSKLPAISTRKQVEHTNQGEIDMATPMKKSHELSDSTVPATADATYGAEQISSSADYARRESDLASAASRSTANRDVGLGFAEDKAQKSFLQSHDSSQAQASTATRGFSSDNEPSRPASPPKGRVHEIATKYNTLHDRRSPTGSFSSWTSSPLSPSKEEVDMPRSESPRILGREETRLPPQRSQDNSLPDLQPPPRPSLPGEWVSYAGSVASTDASAAHSSSGRYESAAEQRDASRPGSRLATPRGLQDTSHGIPDFSPTTTRRPLAGMTHDVTNDDGPMAALAAAGSALAENFKQSIGMGGDETSSVSEADDSSMAETPSVAESSDIRARSATDSTQRPPAQQRLAASNASSVPPTPPQKDHIVDRDGAPQCSSGYFPSTTPLHVANPEQSQPMVTTQTVPSASHQTSTRPQHDDADAENDRLQRDIERSLSPSTPTFPSDARQHSTTTSAHHHDQTPDQLQFNSRSPQDRGSYLAGNESLSGSSKRQSYASSGQIADSPSTPKQNPMQEPVQRTSKMESPTLGQTPATRPNFLGNRFSWEESQDSSSGPSAPVPHERQQSGQYAHERASLSSDEALPQRVSSHTDPSSGICPGDLDHQAQRLRNAPTPPSELPSQAGPPALPPKSLQEVTPSSIELPGSGAMKQQNTGLRRPSEPLATPQSPTLAQRVRAASLAGQKPGQGNVPGLRQISAIKQPGDRINAYRSAQDQYSFMETGLNDWLSYMIHTHPEHAQVPTDVPRPTVNTTGLAGTIRNKVPPSITKLTQNVTSDHSQPASGRATEPGNAMSPDRSASTSQSKRQELLHTAGVFGGKASQGAKGLFAKSKSRFRGASSEKAESPSTSPAESRGMLSSFRRRSRQLSSNSSHSGSPSFIRPSTASTPSAGVLGLSNDGSQVQASPGDIYSDRETDRIHGAIDQAPPRIALKATSASQRNNDTTEQSYFPDNTHDARYDQRRSQDTQRREQALTDRSFDGRASAEEPNLQHDNQLCRGKSRDEISASTPAQGPFVHTRRRQPDPEPLTFLNYRTLQDDELEDDHAEAKRPRPWVHGQTGNAGSYMDGRTNSSSGASEIGIFGARGQAVWDGDVEPPSSNLRRSHKASNGSLQASWREDQDTLREALADRERDAYAPMPLVKRSEPAQDVTSTRMHSSSGFGTRDVHEISKVTNQDASAPATLDKFGRPFDVNGFHDRVSNNRPRREVSTADTILHKTDNVQPHSSYPSSYRTHSRNQSSQSFVSAMSNINDPSSVSRSTPLAATAQDPTGRARHVGSAGTDIQERMQAPLPPVPNLQRPEPSQVFTDLYLDPRQQNTEYNIPGVGPPSRSSKVKSWFPFRRSSQPPSPELCRSRSNSIGDMLAAATRGPTRVDPRISSQRPVSMDSSQLLSGGRAERPKKDRLRNPSTDLLSQYSQDTADILSAAENDRKKTTTTKSRSRSRSRFRRRLTGTSTDQSDVRRASTEPITPDDRTKKKRRSSLIGSLFRRSNTMGDDEHPMPASNAKSNKLAKPDTRGSRPGSLDPRGGNVSMAPEGMQAEFDRVPRVPTLPNLPDLNDGSLGMSSQYTSASTAHEDSYAWRARGNTATSYDGVPPSISATDPATTPSLPAKVEDPHRTAHVAFLQRNNIFPARTPSAHSPAAADTTRNRHSMYEYKSPTPNLPEEDSYFGIPQQKRYYAAQAQAFSPGPGGITPRPSETPKKQTSLPAIGNAIDQRPSSSAAPPGMNPLRQHPTREDLLQPSGPPPPPPPRSPSRPVSRGAVSALTIPEQRQQQSSHSPSPVGSSPPKPSPITASSSYTNRPSMSYDAPASTHPAPRDRSASSAVNRPRELSATRQYEHAASGQREPSMTRQREPSATRPRERSVSRPRTPSASRRISWHRNSGNFSNRNSITSPPEDMPPAARTFSLTGTPAPFEQTHTSRGAAAALPDSGIRARMAAREAEWEDMTSAVAATRTPSRSPMPMTIKSGDRARVLSLPPVASPTTDERARQYASQIPAPVAADIAPALGSLNTNFNASNKTRNSTSTGLKSDQSAPPMQLHQKRSSLGGSAGGGSMRATPLAELMRPRPTRTPSNPIAGAAASKAFSSTTTSTYAGTEQMRSTSGPVRQKIIPEVTQDPRNTARENMPAGLGPAHQKSVPQVPSSNQARASTNASVGAERMPGGFGPVRQNSIPEVVPQDRRGAYRAGTAGRSGIGRKTEEPVELSPTAGPGWEWRPDYDA